MNEELIQVLWVEDDPEITLSFPLEAAQYGIELVPFGCWENAEKSLVAEFSRWSAIVLDAKCKYKHDSHDNAAVFLTQAMHAIDKLCAEKHRILPWYVLSGGSEEELNDLIIDSREEWDGDWKEKKYYSKTTDRDILFHRIPYHAKISQEMQIRLVHYPDVFKAIRNAELDSQVEVIMEDLLLPIHFQKYTTGKEYNDKMTSVRICIEYIFQSMAKNGILPYIIQDNQLVTHGIITGKKGEVNNNWCSLILSGKEIPKRSKSGEPLLKSNNILPDVFRHTFQDILDIVGAKEHAENGNATEEQKAKSRHTQEFLDTIDNAPYLLRSLAMDLCNIILWYASYLDAHNDVEENAKNWEISAS